MGDSSLSALVVGTGFGCRIQVPALRAAGFDVVGLVGADPQRTAERAAANAVPQAFTDLDRAISETGATVVAISTPPHTHGPLSLTAIARGCHVLCEKPFARDAAEARTLLDAAERTGVVHMIGHEFRWVPQRSMLARLIASGAIGEPRLATFTSFIPYLVDPNIDMPNWWFDEEAGGGWLGAAGSHLVDWIHTLFGGIDSLSASLQALRPAHDGADDTFTFRFHCANGAEGVVQQSAAAWGPPLDIVRIVGSSGSIWLDNNDINIGDSQGTRVVPIDPDLELPPIPPLSTDPRQQSPKWQMLAQIELPPYLLLSRAFRALIEGGPVPREPVIPTFADGLACMEVLDAIRDSADAGGTLVSMQH